MGKIQEYGPYRFHIRTVHGVRWLSDAARRSDCCGTRYNDRYPFDVGYVGTRAYRTDTRRYPLFQVSLLFRCRRMHFVQVERVVYLAAFAGIGLHLVMPVRVQYFPHGISGPNVIDIPVRLSDVFGFIGDVRTPLSAAHPKTGIPYVPSGSEQPGRVGRVSDRKSEDAGTLQSDDRPIEGLWRGVARFAKIERFSAALGAFLSRFSALPPMVWTDSDRTTGAFDIFL